jgi:hypothetical protein
MKTVGGTLVSRICSLSPYGGKLAAYFELTEDVQAERTAAMGRGNALEASVLALWRERHAGTLASTNLWTPPEPIRAPALPHAHARVDALAPWDPESSVIIEAKTASAYEMSAWGPDGSDKVPEAYHVQAMHYLGVCKAAGLAVVDHVEMPVLSGTESDLQWAARLAGVMGKPLTLADIEGTGLDFRVCRVEWDAALFAALNERVCRFLADHVAPRIPPPPGDGDLLGRDAHAVRKGLRAEKGTALDFDALSPVEQAVLLEVVEASRQRKQWEGLEEQARTRAQLLMGGTEEVRGLPGGAVVRWREMSAGTRRFEIREPKEGR